MRFFDIIFLTIGILLGLLCEAIIHLCERDT